MESAKVKCFAGNIAFFHVIIWDNNLAFQQTCFGEPKSRMSSLLLGITFTLTLSSGSITSLKTLSSPSTTSWARVKNKDS